MLVLTRHVDEKIMIGDDITITICRINEFTVRIGIDAPEDVSVHREEVYRKINKDENNET